MANIFTNLVPPAGNGVGAAVDVSAMGPIKTITVQATFTGVVTIEYSEDAGASFAQLVTFAAGGKKTVTLAAQFMRVRRAGVGAVPGTPDIDVASDDVGQLFANLPVPAGNGVGASVDVSLLGTLNTIVVGGTFTGNVAIEISEDGTVWSQCLFFQSTGGGQTKEFIAQFMRVRRGGVGVVPGTPIVNVGAANDPSSSLGDNTLDQAYDQGGAGAGRTINADAGAVLIQSVAADNNHVVEVIKNPVGAQAGDAINVAMGAPTTGRGVFVDQNGSGNAVQVQHGGAGDAVAIALDGTAVGAQAVVITETAVARTAVMVSLTRDALATAAAHVLQITNPGDGRSIDVVSGDVFFAGDFDVAGLSAFGSLAAVSASRILEIDHNFGEADASVVGVECTVRAQETTGATANIITGITGRAFLNALNTEDWTATVGMRGVESIITIQSASGETVTGAAGFYAGNAFSTVTLTRQMGMFIEPMTRGATDNIGIWIEEPSTGAALNDAIHVVGGRSFFDGTMVVGDVAKAFIDTDFDSHVYVGRLFTNPTLESSLVSGAASAAETVAPNAHFVASNNGVVIIDVTNTEDWTDTVGMRAVVGGSLSLPGSTGVITGVAAFYAIDTIVFGATFTNQFGLFIEAMTAAVTDNIGIWIETPSGGAGLNDAIHVVGGRTFLGGDLVVSGRAAVGGDAAITSTITGVFSETFTEPGAAVNVIGIASLLTAEHTSEDYTDQANAIVGVGLVGAANDQDWTSVAGLTAFRGRVETIAASTGAVTSAAAYHAQDATIGGATITRLMGMLINSMTEGVTDNIGIWIETPSGGGGLSDAIHVVGGRTFIGGTIQIDQGVALGGGAAPTFGTIGGGGPAVAAQNEWIAITTQNGARFVPAWA